MSSASEALISHNILIARYHESRLSRNYLFQNKFNQAKKEAKAKEKEKRKQKAKADVISDEAKGGQISFMIISIKALCLQPAKPSYLISRLRGIHE